LSNIYLLVNRLRYCSTCVKGRTNATIIHKKTPISKQPKTPIGVARVGW